MIDILILLLCFVFFAIVQAIFINGVYDCFKGSMVTDGVSGKVYYQGMVLYMMAPKFFETNKHKAWSKPIYSCVRCMASFWGGVTFWPTVIYLFGFHFGEIFLFIVDVFMLVYLNFFFYKQL